jgi:hypothetical protein
MIALCLIAGTVVASLPLPGNAFSLRWTHSVEKVEWQEDYGVTLAGLSLREARIRGSGAGMEPPDGAVLKNGWWVYRPEIAPLARLTLAASGHTDDHWLCVQDDCRPLSALTGGAGPVTLEPCETSR